MKKILLVCLLILGLTGCSNDLAKLANNKTIKYNINNGFNKDDILKNIKEGTTIETKLDEENSKLIITLNNGDITQTLEQAVEIEYPLATLSDETLDINAYNFDPTKILNDLKEGTDVKYELKDNEVVITLTNGDQVDTIKRSANISHPLAWFNDDITIDTYYGYKIEELINLSDGTTIVSDDLVDDVLSVTVSNGEREETIETKVNLTNSSPYPIHCPGTVNWDGLPTATSLTFLSDNEVELYSPYTGTETGFYDNNNLYFSNYAPFIVKTGEYEFYESSGEKTGFGNIAKFYYKCDKPVPFGN